MRRLYLTVQYQRLIRELFEGDVEAIRNPFRVLLSEEAIEHLLAAGAANGESYFRDRHSINRDRLPFVPGLGAIRLHPKAQLEHRGIYHDYGNSCYPPTAFFSSPTGLRLVNRTEEMVSDSHLSDTYESERNRSLTRRMVGEGAIDGFVSTDQSTWHVALSIEPRRRITVTARGSEGASRIEGAQIEPRAYIHIYPYGAMTVTVGISLIFPRERSTVSAIELVQALIGRRAPSDFDIQMRGVPALPIQDFSYRLADMTGRAIVPGYAVDNGYRHPLHYAVSISAEEDNLSDRELAGLLTLDPKFDDLGSDWVSARASLYGKYGGDRVVATRGSLGVATSPRSFSRSGHRRFFWRCHAIKEFATLQASTLSAITHELNAAGLPKGPDELLTTRLMATAEHLIELPRALPAHHRKWFYECQRVVNGDGTVDRYLNALAEFHNRARQAAIIRRLTDARKITLDLTNSQIGTLNFGSIVGDVQNHLIALDDPVAADVRDGMATLTQAVIDVEGLEDDRRQELLEAIDVLAEEAKRSPNQRRASVVRSVLRTLTTAVSAVAALSEVWAEVEPVITGFFS